MALDMVRVLLLDGTPGGFLGVFPHCVVPPYLSSSCAIYPVSLLFTTHRRSIGVWRCVYICLLFTRHISFREVDTRPPSKTVRQLLDPSPRERLSA